MRDVLCFLVFMTAFAMPSLAQRTEYYRWTKTYAPDGTVRTETRNQGQFITRTGQVCYDSDKEGVSVGNGKLRLVNRQGTVSKYVGSCYYGEECGYTFYDSEKILNIETPGGSVYVYALETPPSGCRTSSLIRQGADGTVIGTVMTDNPAVPHEGNGSSSRKKTEHPKRCSKCSGRGICTTCGGRKVYRPNAYSKNTVTCSVCSGSGKCSLCGGTGTFGSVWY